MPHKRHIVTATLWTRSFRNVSMDAKGLMLFVLSCSQRNSEGLYQLPAAIAAVHLNITEDEVLDAFEELRGAGVAAYDPEVEVVLDRTALKGNPIRSPEDGRIKNAVRLFELVPESPLREDFMRLAAVHSPPLADAIREELGFVPGPPGKGDPLGDPPGEGEGVREEKSRDEESRVELSTVQHETACPDCDNPLDLTAAGTGCKTCDPDERRRSA